MVVVADSPSLIRLAITVFLLLAKSYFVKIILSNLAADLWYHSQTTFFKA